MFQPSCPMFPFHVTTKCVLLWCCPWMMIHCNHLWSWLLLKLRAVRLPVCRALWQEAQIVPLHHPHASPSTTSAHLTITQLCFLCCRKSTVCWLSNRMQNLHCQPLWRGGNHSTHSVTLHWHVKAHGFKQSNFDTYFATYECRTC